MPPPGMHGSNRCGCIHREKGVQRLKISSPILMLIRSYVRRRDTERLNDLLSEMHSVDVHRCMNRLEAEVGVELVTLLHPGLLADVLSDMEQEEQREVLSWVSDDRRIEILNEMPIDEVVDLLGIMPDGEVREILPRLEDRAEIERLLTFDLDTAAGLMTTEFISVDCTASVRDAIGRIQDLAEEAETIYYVYVTDDASAPVGVMSLRELLAADWKQPVSEVMKENLVSVEEGMDQEKVAHVIAKYDLLAVPVVNGDGVLSGIVTVDDIVDVMEEETTEDLFKKAGLTETGDDLDEYRSARLIQSDLRTVVRIRLPWLVFALVGGMIAGVVIGSFEETLETVVALAFFIPVIMDMGGNVGTQSSTIFVRGFALGHVDRSRFIPYLVAELKVGVTLGAVSGVLVGLMAHAWQDSPALGVVVGVSMMFTVLLATVIGFAIPWALVRLDWDPAAGSDPLITTVKDVTGLLIYFAMARALMQYL